MKLYVITWRCGKTGLTADVEYYAPTIREALKDFRSAIRDIGRPVHFVAIRAATSIASFMLVI